MAQPNKEVITASDETLAAEPVETLNTRQRVANVRIDVEEVRLEELLRLKQVRGGKLSAVTVQRKEIDELLKNPANFELIQSKFIHVQDLFEKFLHSNSDVQDLLQGNEVELSKSSVYVSEIEESFQYFYQKVKDWLSVTKSMFQNNQVKPEDSVSQVESVASKRSKVRSKVSSCVSNASSLSSVRAKEAMKRAELQTEALAMKQKHSLEEEEFRLKHEAMKIKLRKEEFALETEVAKAQAREEALARVEEEEGESKFRIDHAPKVESKSVFPYKELQTPKVESKPSVSPSLFVPKIESKPVFPPKELHMPEVEFKPSVSPSSLVPKVEYKPFVSTLNPLATGWPSSAFTRPLKTDKVPTYARPGPSVSHDFDSTNQILKQQNLIMQEIITQQQRVTLPKWQVPVFQGNPLEYQRFIRAFEAMIETREPDFTSRLYYLEQFTAGHAKELVRSCQHMAPEEGYRKARSLIKEKFGHNHKLAVAYVERVMSAEPVKSEDVSGLETFSILLASCKNSLKAIGYLNKIENSESMRKIIEKLPYKLQERWRDTADDIMNVKCRDVTIEDISKFVDRKVRAMTNPVFGKLNAKQTLLVKYPKPKSSSVMPVGNVSFASNCSLEDTKSAESEPSWKSKSSEEAKKKCPVCDGYHQAIDCRKLKDKSVKDRFALVRELKLCFGCLKRGHTTKTCFKKKPCYHCDRKHSTLLHASSPEKSKVKEEKSQETQVHCGLVNSEDQFCGLSGSSRNVAVLPVVAVKVRIKDSPTCIETYALLDSGSNSTFCSESLVKRLGVDSVDVKLKLTTLGSKEEVSCSLVRNLEISDLDENKFVMLSEVFTRPNIPVSPDEIPTPDDADNWSHLQGHVQLSVLKSDVDLLIGVDVPEALEPKEIIASQNGGPYATKSDLGWTINGPTGRRHKNSTPTSFFVQSDKIHPVCSSCTEFIDVYEDCKGSLSREDLKFMEIARGTICQEEDSHYSLALPVRDPEKSFPQNRFLAERRMGYLKRKFEKQPNFKEDYTTFIQDMFKKGYAEKVEPEKVEEVEKNKKIWYLPHHGVYHPKKPEKIRVVFDCSAKFQGTSLNDRLLQGPDLTNSLVGVLTRFRLEPVAVMADVEAMFYQVRVEESDRGLLRFLWWPDGNVDSDYEEYQLSVHVFGATSSPSCANFAMRKHAESSVDEFGLEVVETVLRNFYVDDCLKSLPTTEIAINHVQDLSNLMAKGGFKLTKWVSNDREVLDTVPEDKRAKEIKNLDLDNDSLPVERALGVDWCIETDTFKFTVGVKDKPSTRRGMLSITSSIYDPLGMVSPFVLPAKVLLQDLCRLGLGWDDPIPEELCVKWEKWLDSLPDLGRYFLNRCFKPHNFGTVVSTQVHHFSDASLSAYGSVCYLRLVNQRGEVHCSFLMSKSRLAPLKNITIPRLELAAAAVSVRVNKIVKSELGLNADETKFWTDSMTVLRYLQQENKRFHTYVGNRVAYIRNDTSPDQWNYVDTKSNPADDVSRGMSSEIFLSCHRWKNGPEFLWKPESEWPKRPDIGEITGDDPEVKTKVTTMRVDLHSSKTQTLIKIFERFSSWLRLKKFVALCLRLQKRVRSKSVGAAEKSSVKSYSLILVQELEDAEKEILKIVQQNAYKEDIKMLSTGGHLKKSSPLIKLDPVLIDGVLCVGGRLSRAPVPSSQKHQLIIPKNSHIAKLVVWHYHVNSGHSGREHVLSLIRERFWLVNAHSTLRKVLRSCFSCRRRLAPVMQQKMADLPLNRISPGNPPFTYVGIDYFGPFYVKQKRSLVKRYGAIFTCLVVRAVHIEVAYSLDSDSFIQALRRFIARRGQVKEIRSDNGSNFVGAQRELREAIQEWNQKQIHDFLLQKNIVWLFNPPAASHHGGVWERCIRSVRKVLNALLKEQTLSDESLQTLMCEVESVINSRPLTTVSNDPKDLEPLTPNHLLQLRQPSVVPPGVFDKSDVYSRKRWKQVQYLSDIFWKRWVREYLPSLQVKQKWFHTQRNVSVGDIVLIVDESSHRSSWPLGRVVEVYPDTNGLVRSAKVATATTSLVRPISKLCLLEAVEVQSEVADQD